MRIYMYAVALAGLFTLRFLPTYSTNASVPVDAFYLFTLRFLSTYSTRASRASIASLELQVPFYVFYLRF
jgi:hypothetical protein